MPSPVQVDPFELRQLAAPARRGTTITVTGRNGNGHGDYTLRVTRN